jgi:uncharacterized protein (TIRG00374 family)
VTAEANAARGGRAARIAGSLALSGLCLYLAARGISWPEVWAVLGRTRWLYVVPMALPALLTIWVRALRWRIFVLAVARVRTETLISATAIGFAANMLLPLRAGEILRPWVLARKEPIAFASAMATVALERLFDMATLLFLFSLATLFLPLPAEWRGYGWVFAATFVLLLAGLVALQRAPEAVIRLLASILWPFPQGISRRILTVARHFGEGLGSLGSLRAMAGAVALSLGVWLSIALSFGFGLSALALPVPWFEAALAVTTFVAIAVAIPGGPGFVGMFQAGCVIALAMYGVERSVAFSYSILTHLVQFVSTVALGAYFFLREGLSIRDVGTLSEPALRR